MSGVRIVRRAAEPRERCPNPGARWVRVGFLLLAIGLIALGSAWEVFHRENRRLTDAQQNMCIFDCHLVLIGDRVLPAPTVPTAGLTRLTFTATVMPEMGAYTAPKRPLWFGWMWGRSRAMWIGG